MVPLRHMTCLLTLLLNSTSLEMKTTFTLLLACLLVSTAAVGQSIARSVVASQGEISENEMLSLEWTLGESFAESDAADRILLTSGFHQYSLPLTPLRPNWSPLNENGDKVQVGDDMDLHAFPNPFHSELTVRLVGSYSDEQQYRIQFINNSGMVMHAVNIPQGNRQVRFNQLEIPSGMYVITVQGLRDGKIRTSQIIKTD